MTVTDGSELTAAELVALIEAPQVFVDATLDLLDSDDVWLADLTEDFVATGSSVERGIYRTIHGTATLNVTRDLQWGSQRLRPWLLLSNDGTDWWRWPLGIFIPTVPERVVGESPSVFTVSCFDKLDVLNTPIGSASVEAGENVVTAVEALIQAAGETSINIVPSSAVTAASRVYSLQDQWTVLTTINDLLDSIGYRAISVDNQGVFVSEPYRPPSDLPQMWSYSASSATSTVAQSRTSTADYYQAPNVVIAYVNAATDDTIPTEGDGRVTLTNEFDGPTSISGRGGRIIREIISGPYTSQDALESAASAALDTAKRITTYVTIAASPNPTHGHFDVVAFRDDDLGLDGRMLVTDWVLSLSGDDMSISMRAV